jgi:hypothetical protein
MDGTGDHHVGQNKLDSEKITCFLSYKEFFLKEKKRHENKRALLEICKGIKGSRKRVNPIKVHYMHI